MSNNYIVRAIAFINSFFPYIENCGNYTDEYREAIERFNSHYHRRVRYDDGASRRVFITSDYVVKMDKCKSVWGNCEDEYQFYLDCSEYYKHCFAEVTKVSVKGHNFYIMPRAHYIGVGTNIDKFTVDEWAFISHKVDDLHEYNIGRIKNKPVIIDYACVCAKG